MSKITSDLVQMAEQHARRILIEVRQSLMPTWVLVDAKNKMTIVGTPWRDDGEKELMAGQIRKEIRDRRIKAYSFVTEAWRATAQGPNFAGLRASNMPDKKEIVMAFACDGADQEFRTWEIQRDWHERVTNLSPMDRGDEKPEGWLCEMLVKSHG